MNREKLLKAIENKTGWEIPSNIFSLPDFPNRDSDEILTTKGCHRIVVSLEGNYMAFSPTVMFQGWDRNGFACYVYGHGGIVADSHYIFDYENKPFCQVEALTSFDCERFIATIAFLNAEGICSQVGVTCQGYVNNELIQEDHRLFEMSKQFICNFEYFDSKKGFTNK